MKPESVQELIAAFRADAEESLRQSMPRANHMMGWANRLAESVKRGAVDSQPAPCSVCGDTTEHLCADCVIDRVGRIRVCPNPECRDVHEANGTHKHPTLEPGVAVEEEHPSDSA